MLRFTLKDQKVLLVHLNTRAENHGEEVQSAADLKLRVDLTNDRLDDFDPNLKSFLYYFDKEREADLADQANDAPHIRVPSLGLPLKWTAEMTGAMLTVHHGIGGRSDLVLKDTKVNAFQILPREGGTIEITLRVQCHPDEKQFGRLSQMLKKEVQVSIEAQSENEEQEQSGN